MKILNKFGKFGSLLIGRCDGRGGKAKDHNTSGADDLSYTNGDATEPRSSNPNHPRMGSPFSYGGPFSGKIRFKNVK
jgi:hypothetical protein